MMLSSSERGRVPNESAVRRPGVVAFVGRSGSGKTTFLLKLLPVLRARQVRIAMVKHSSHRGIETDRRGSDSRRLWEAGVDDVVLVTPDRVVHTRRVAVEPPLEEVLSTLKCVDLVILEGFKRSDVAKIEVVRAACTSEHLGDLQGRVACITDVVGLGVSCPMFDLDDVVGVADFVMDHFVALS